MQYAKVVTPTREALIALEPSNWGAPYQKLFDQMDASGWEVWEAYSHEGFNNPFQNADEARRKLRRNWAEILRDTVMEGGKGVDGKGRLNMRYVSHAGTAWEKQHDLWAPEKGYWVPTNDGVFHEGTLIPFETMQNRGEATKLCEAKGIPAEQVSYFFRLDRYNGEMYVGRGFGPGWGGGSCFAVDAHWLPSGSGVGEVASRPAYGKLEIVMEVAEPIDASR